jgi:hypothetical protein
VSANRHIKKAKEDALKDTISVSKPEHFPEKRFILFLTMVCVWVLIYYASFPAFRPNDRMIRPNGSLSRDTGIADPPPLSRETAQAQEGLSIMINNTGPKFNPGLKMAVQACLLKSSLK